MRCFVAISIPDEVKARLERLQHHLKSRDSGVRWIPPASQHLTLKFLGEVKSHLMDRIEEAAEEAAALSPAFSIRIGQLGAFPNLSRPRVIWVGVHEEGRHLAALVSRLEKLLKPLGFEAEDRAWSPHITIGRVKDAFVLKALTDYIRIESDVFDAGVFQAASMILYQSVLRPEGALYSPLKRFVFIGKPGANDDT